MGELKKERRLKVYETTAVLQNKWGTRTKYKKMPQIRLKANGCKMIVVLAPVRQLK